MNKSDILNYIQNISEVTCLNYIINTPIKINIIVARNLLSELELLIGTSNSYINIITDIQSLDKQSINENYYVYFGNSQEEKEQTLLSIKHLISEDLYQYFKKKSILNIQRIYNRCVFDLNFLKNNIDSLFLLSESFFNDTEKYKYFKILYALLNQNSDIITRLINKNPKYSHNVVFPEKKENILSGGVTNGNEVISFLKKITDSGFLYGFEIINSNFLSIKKMLDETSYKNFEIINKALSDKKKSITFIKNCDLPKLAEDGKIEIQSTTIDLFLSGKKVDLIKLDVNGDEYNVLVGAKQTIKNFTPKLMINLNKYDINNFLLIPQLLLSYNKNYKFFIEYYDRKNLFNDIVLFALNS